MQTTAKTRGLAAAKTPPADAAPDKPAPDMPRSHSDFLRAGSRKRYKFSPEEVAAHTGKVLEAAGEQSHQRLNAFHRSVQFPKIIFHRTLDKLPHLGYCHVTAARTIVAQRPLSWSFYIANFLSEIGGEGRPFFERIKDAEARMFFAVAVKGEPGKSFEINRSVRNSGLLFQTSDPRQAIRNVLTLGTSSEQLREIIKKL